MLKIKKKPYQGKKNTAVISKYLIALWRPLYLKCIVLFQKRFILRLGGDDIPTFIRTTIRKLITDELAINYTWNGTLAKQSFKAFFLISFITGKGNHSHKMELSWRSLNLCYSSNINLLYFKQIYAIKNFGTLMIKLLIAYYRNTFFMRRIALTSA